MKVYVANMGVISALGNGVAENLAMLEKAEHGLHNSAGYLDPALSHMPVGKVALSDNDLSHLLGVKGTIPRTSLLSLAAAREALGNFDLSGIRLGFISATTVGGMTQSEHFFKTYIPQQADYRKEDILYHTCGSATEQAAKYLPRLSYISTINTACSSAANALILAARKLQYGQLDAVVAGGSDALCRFTLNGFNSLMILDDAPCRPFDECRKGLNLGEGAGYVLLVSEKTASERNIKPLAELRGYANANDAFHATASSDNGEGAFLAMSNALAKANLSPDQIDYINLHGTGTSNNDLSESIAIKRVFGKAYPLVSSTKSYTGHTLGASGGIEAVYSILSIQRQVAFPNLRFGQPMKETMMSPVKTLVSRNINHVLSNSFGFGGNSSSLVFSGTI